MKHHNNVFHQLLKELPRYQFQKVVDRHNGDHRIRTLSCWTQLVSMMFAQLTGRSSLRDLEENFNTKHKHHYHLGVETIKRSSLSDLNSSHLPVTQEQLASMTGCSRNALIDELKSLEKESVIVRQYGKTEVADSEKLEWSVRENQPF
ncbi:hypothetical protein ACH42_06240 [Endozoicomonas sp. (ex Bugula neritina AB1)]|nr:hypothetical protein ACH42_06240 [Endozoicomonas sp. (ex Bugula neritina AB1)]